jgi:hypothetical protein
VRGPGQLPDTARGNFRPRLIGAAGDLDRTTAGHRTMMTNAEQRAMLARMETAHAETARHLAVIERQIAARAERMTTSSRVKARQFDRASAAWSRADERAFQDALATLRFARRGEIDALSRKLARQAGAIAAYRIRYRSSELAGEGVS